MPNLYLPHIQTAPAPPTAQSLPCGMAALEWEVMQRIAAHPGQRRGAMQCDARLVLAARAKCEIMRAANTVAHVFDGVGPHDLVRRYGYRLPALYPDGDANYIESIAAGQAGTIGHPDMPVTQQISAAQQVVETWLASDGHRRHILAQHDFYAAQTHVGVGYSPLPSPRGWRHWWCFLSCHPER